MDNGNLIFATLLQILYLYHQRNHEYKIKLGRPWHYNICNLCHSLRFAACCAKQPAGFWHKHHSQFIF